MDEFLFLKIVDWIKQYGMQAFGIIVIIYLSKFFIQAILLIFSFIVFIILGIVQLIFSILLVLLNILPAALHHKLNKLIVKIESFIRKVESSNRNVKEWCAGAPHKYVNVHRKIMKSISFSIKLAGVAVIVVFIINVFIQKSLNVEQIFNYL